MGSSSSVFRGSCDVFISFDDSEKENQEVRALCSELEKENIRVACSNDFDYTEYIECDTEKKVEIIEKMMSKSRLFIICISPNTFRSFQQSIEWNYSLKGNRKIVFLTLDGNYTPAQNTFLQYVVQYHRWFPLSERYLASEIINLLASEDKNP
jgi:hypothetical protein